MLPLRFTLGTGFELPIVDSNRAVVVQLAPDSLAIAENQPRQAGRRVNFGQPRPDIPSRARRMGSMSRRRRC